MKNFFNTNEIENMLKNSHEEIIEDDVNVVDEFGNIHNVNEIIEKAESYVKKKYPKINFRWSEFEIARAKKIAKQLGMPYQTYIKSILKQAMDNDEKRLQQM